MSVLAFVFLVLAFFSLAIASFSLFITEAVMEAAGIRVIGGWFAAAFVFLTFASVCHHW